MSSLSLQYRVRQCFVTTSKLGIGLNFCWILEEMDRPEGANEHCPGAQSEGAGKASACAGCPNQSLCASGDTQRVDPALEVIQARMASVHHKLFVMSGKGGVGKSTFANLLSRALARRLKNKTIALLDLDICGPSQPRMMGALNEQVHRSGSGWSPVFIEDNLALMSIGFLLNSADDAVIWRGPKKNSMIQQFLSEVDWGETVEYLVLDTPPGTSDEHISSASYLASPKKATSSGGETAQAILITTPSEVSVADVRRQVTFCRKVGIEIIGLIENMTGFVCPKCTTHSTIFPNDCGGGESLCKEMGIELLESLPIDTRVTRACDEGSDPWEMCDGASPLLDKLDTLVDKIIGVPQ